MPVYTVHAPFANGADLRATDKFVFVRDGFHVWATLLGPLWLARNGLWLSLIAWIIVLGGLWSALAYFGASSSEIALACLIFALLVGFEGASLYRWRLSRRHWRQLDVVVADDAERAERRFFDRWAAKQGGIVNDQHAVDRGAPPPTRDPPGESFSRAPTQGSGIIGLFPEPGGPK